MPYRSRFPLLNRRGVISPESFRPANRANPSETAGAFLNGTVTADDHFTYDVFDRRIGKLTNDGTQTYTYDLAGNRTMKTSALGVRPQMS